MKARPSTNEYVETQIAGENLKVTKHTDDYIQRFSDFLNQTPDHKMKFLKDKFFNRLPKMNGISKQRKKGIKCGCCLKPLQSDQQLKDHMEREHAELVDLGVQVQSANEYKISNKLVNYVAIFCLTNPHDIKPIMDRIVETKFGEVDVLKLDEMDSEELENKD